MKKLSEVLCLPNLTDIHIFLKPDSKGSAMSRFRILGNITAEETLELDLPWAWAENFYSLPSVGCRSWRLDSEDSERPPEAGDLPFETEGRLSAKRRGLVQKVNNGVRHLRLTLAENLGSKTLFVRVLPGSPLPLEDVSGERFFQLMDYNGPLNSGLFLVSGQAGSGKSTYLASVLQNLVERLPIHIVSLEDPVEYTITPAKGYATQKEVYFDTPSFREALRDSMREDPDVLFIGEIRDRETAETALNAAESGHLVLGTIHAGSNAGIVDRLLGLFGASAPVFVAQRISQCLGLCLSISRTGTEHKYTYEKITDSLRAVIRKQELHQWKQYSTPICVVK